MIRRLDNMRKLLLQLGKVHLTEDEILDYCDGLLKDDKETKSIATHLERCFRCREQVRGIQEVLSPSWATRLRWPFGAAYRQKVAAQTQLLIEDVPARFRSPFRGKSNIAWKSISVAAAILILLLPILFVMQMTRFNIQEASIFLQGTKGFSKGVSGSGSESNPLILYSGDTFQVSFRTSQNAYIYLINYDSQGKKQEIFPSDGIELTNHVEGKRRYSIPSDKEPPFRFLYKNTGMETIFVLASKDNLTQAQIDTVKRQIESFGPPQSGEEYQNKIKRIRKTLKNQGFKVESISIDHR